MDENKFEKTIKDVKWFSIVVLVLYVAIFGYNIYLENINIISIIMFVTQIAILIGTAIGCNAKKMYGPILGIVVGVLMIISLSILDIILGICLISECIRLIIYMRK